MALHVIDKMENQIIGIQLSLKSVTHLIQRCNQSSRVEALGMEE